MRAVLDTDVLVSALMTRGGTCDQIVRRVIDGAVQPCAGRRVLAEYGRVLPRPLFRIPPGDVADMMDLIGTHADFVTPAPLDVRMPHADDLPFLEVAAEPGVILVTGNLRHFPRRSRAGVTVLSPREFLDLLEGAL